MAKIKEEIEEEIDAGDYGQKMSLDPKGYFLIRILRDKKMIEVGHCTNNHKLIRVIKGKKPESIMYKIIDEGHISKLDHAAYLGKELSKAYVALKNDMEYVQDSE